MHCALYVFYEANKDDYYLGGFSNLHIPKVLQIVLVGLKFLPCFTISVSVAR